MLLIRMAWRNLWRRTRRTILTVTTVSLGLALMLISLGLGDGGHRQWIDTGIAMGSGHILIQKKGYQESGETEQFMTDDQLRQADAWLDEMAKAYPVQRWVKRIFASGLASSSDGSAGVQLIGVEPDREAQVSLFDDKLKDGVFFGGDPDGAVIGLGVARKLELKVGGKMVIMAQAAHQVDIESKLVRIAGIVSTGVEDLDRILVLIDYETAREFLNIDGAHQVAAFLENETEVHQLVDRGRSLQGLEVLGWDDALPELRDAIAVDDGGNYVFQFMIFVLIAFTVMNTLLMSVLERKREFSLLDSMGLAPFKRFRMVIWEACFVSLLAMGCGLALGYGGHLYFAIYGFPLDLFYDGDITAAGILLDPVFYSVLTFRRILGSLMLVVSMTLGLALLPALRAARAGDVHLLGKH